MHMLQHQPSSGMHKNIVIPVRQSGPVLPCTQVHVPGAVHSLFTPQPPVQIATGKCTVYMYMYSILMFSIMIKYQSVFKINNIIIRCGATWLQISYMQTVASMWYLSLKKTVY